MGAPGARVICPDCHSPLLEGKCGACGFAVKEIDGLPVYLSKADFSDTTFSSYTENYETISQDDLAASMQEPVYLQTQTEKFAGYLGDVNGKDVCEIGVGQGRLLKKLESKAVRSLVGVDIATNYLRKLRNEVKAKLIVANAENLPFQDEFDVIVSSDVLEHVLNVGDFMISVNQALRMGGQVLLKVPFEENLLQYAQRTGCKYRFVHLRTFSKDNLTRLMLDSGFQPVKFHYDGFTKYRVRKWIPKYRVTRHVYFRRFLAHYESENHMNAVPNWLGNLMMEPLEIVVRAVKTKNLI